MTFTEKEDIPKKFNLTVTMQFLLKKLIEKETEKKNYGISGQTRNERENVSL